MKATHFALYMAQLEFVIIAIVSIFLVYEFYISKNGMLRKLMIALFASQCFAVVCSALYYLSLEQFSYEPFKLTWVRFVALLPLTITMFLIWRYLHQQHKKNGL